METNHAFDSTVRRLVQNHTDGQTRAMAVARLLGSEGVVLTDAELDEIERKCAPELVAKDIPEDLSFAEEKKLLIGMLRVSSLDSAAQAELMRAMVDCVPQGKLLGELGKWMKEGSVEFADKAECAKYVERLTPYTQREGPKIVRRALTSTQQHLQQPEGAAKAASAASAPYSSPAMPADPPSAPSDESDRMKAATLLLFRALRDRYGNECSSWPGTRAKLENGVGSKFGGVGLANLIYHLTSTLQQKALAIEQIGLEYCITYNAAVIEQIMLEHG